MAVWLPPSAKPVAPHMLLAADLKLVIPTANDCKFQLVSSCAGPRLAQDPPGFCL